MKLLAKFFWRIVLPFLLALATAIWEFLPSSGAGRGIPSGGSDLAHHVVAGLYAAIFCASFGIAFRNSLRWGKEAEGYESHLKDADEIEKERRRRSSWREL
jgi:hypothetical protein